MEDSLANHQSWLAQRQADLVRPDGWLSLIDLVWLEPGPNGVGAAADCSIRLPGVPVKWGELELRGQQVIWHAHDGHQQNLKSDADGKPDVVHLDERFSLFIIEREQGLGVRVRDSQAGTLLGFRGIDRYPFDPDWVLDAHWENGLAVFTYEGHQYRLRPQASATGPLLFVFADSTSGQNTYGGGRFLNALPTETGELMLDFNRAVNPPCAFTPFATCPLPPPENRLPFPVFAGELTYLSIP